MNNIPFTERCREYVRLRNEQVSQWETQGDKLFRQAVSRDWINTFEVMGYVISLNKWLKDHGKMPISFKVVTQEWWDIEDGKPYQLCKISRHIVLETSFLENLNDRIDENSFLVLLKGTLQILNETCA